MQNRFDLIADRVRERVRALMADGTADRLLGWCEGDLYTDCTPFVFKGPDPLQAFVYNRFCPSNQSKYLVSESRKDGRIIALLKPCDTYGFNRLLHEKRIDRDKVYIIGVECDGMTDPDKLSALGIKGILSAHDSGDELVCDTLYGEKTVKRADVLLKKCLACKGGEHMVYDELTYDKENEQPLSVRAIVPENERYDEVARLEGMTADERFEYWRGELSKCIRCNACRNVCPVCGCEQCVFDDPQSGVASKAPADDFEENLFHIIRAFHVAGRCSDCGECARVCPQNIPLDLINRKLIKDINELYGEYCAGADDETPSPLTAYTKTDCEPSVVKERGRA